MPEDLDNDSTLQTLAAHHDIMSKIKAVQSMSNFVLANHDAFSHKALVGLVAMQAEIVNLLALGGELITESSPEQAEKMQEILKTLQAQ